MDQHTRNQKIAELLSHNCRLSTVEIAKTLGEKVSTTWHAVKDLEPNAKLTITIKTDMALTKRQADKIRKIISCLKEEPRMPLTDMCKRTGIPVSTIWDLINDLQTHADLGMTCEIPTKKLSQIIKE